jgi:hypothetical protein
VCVNFGVGRKVITSSDEEEEEANIPFIPINLKKHQRLQSSACPTSRRQHAEAFLASVTGEETVAAVEKAWIKKRSAEENNDYCSDSSISPCPGSIITNLDQGTCEHGEEGRNF